jgi:hypothetical protein
MTYKAKTSDFDEIYKIGNNFMINEKIEDDEGFYKNCYQWATLNGDGSITVHKTIPNTSSYTPWSDAVEEFKTFLKKNEK